jgi:hypothetical protein
MSAYLLPLLSLIVGALIGLFSTLLASSIRQRQDITLRLLDQYLLVRREVVDAVSELSNMSIRDQFDSDEWDKHQGAISKLFYKHYDFLPKAVLDSLTLLYVCLSKPNGTLFTFRNGAVVPMDERDMASFIEDCSIFSNTKYLSPLALKSSNPKIRTNQAIILHARYVLFTLNKFASIEDLLDMTKKLKKATPL